MEIYTSYFANLRNLPPSITPVSVALYPPKGYTGLKYPKLYPPPELLSKRKSGLISDSEYITWYTTQVLNNLDPNQVINELLDMSNSPVCLTCYEQPQQFCHRHIIRNWLLRHGYNIQEYKNETPLW